MKNSLKIIYMGTPEFAVAPLKALLDAGYNIPAVVTVPDKPKGRGLQVAQSSIKEFVLQYSARKIDILQPEKLRNEEFLQQLKSYNADLFIVVAFRMLPEVIWKMPKLGTFNLHASLLPKFRGAAPINWAIIQKEKETGVTTFFIDHNIDSGNILLQSTTKIEERETAETLHNRLKEMGSKLVLQTVQGIENNSITPQPQDTSQLSPNITQAPKLNKTNCRINWHTNAEDVDAQVRGLCPYPAAITTLKTTKGDNIELKIFSTEVVKGLDSSAKPCGKAWISNQSIFVQCNTGVVEITSLQPAGKKRMGAKDFINGQRHLIEDDNLFFV